MRPTALALLIALLAAGVARADSVSLRCEDGRLALSVGDGEEFSRDDCGVLTRWSNPGTYFDGFVSVERDGDTLTLWAGQNATRDWTVSNATLSVAPGRAALLIHLRTPIGLPDEDYRLESTDLTRLVLACPAVVPVLNDLLASIDPDCRFVPDSFAAAQARPESYAPAPGTAAKVAAALGKLEAPDLESRREAVAVLAERDCAEYLTLRGAGMDLSPAQSQGVSQALAGWVVLRTERERETVRSLFIK